MKKKSSVPSEGLLVLFLSKSVNTMTSAENQLYRFNYCLALVLVTIFFELVFTEHWRRSFWLSFLIICRWNLFRTICANSRKVGLGKFLSPYKGIPVDLSRPEPHPHFFMFVHWSVMQERSIIKACRFYSLQWLLHIYVWQFLFSNTLSKCPIMDCILQLPEVVSFWLVHVVDFLAIQ